MTLLSRICFSWILAAAHLHAAVINGQVRLEGSRDKQVQARKVYSGVIVWLEPVEGAARTAPRSARMLQKGKTFVPHILAIPVNSTVEFPNYDPIFHNAFSNFSGQIFDVGLYPPGTSRTVRFRREGIVRVFCNIHPTMSAVIAVLPTMWFAVTDAQGAFTLNDVPPGTYMLKIFHERATESTLERLEQRITVAGNMRLPELVISEADYLPTPHKNKFGKDYPSVIDDGLPYGGPKR